MEIGSESDMERPSAGMWQQWNRKHVYIPKRFLEKVQIRSMEMQAHGFHKLQCLNPNTFSETEFSMPVSPRIL